MQRSVEIETILEKFKIKSDIDLAVGQVEQKGGGLLEKQHKRADNMFEQVAL